MTKEDFERAEQIQEQLSWINRKAEIFEESLDSSLATVADEYSIKTKLSFINLILSQEYRVDTKHNADYKFKEECIDFVYKSLNKYIHAKAHQLQSQFKDL